jgi:uncharacterized membrane-anchored protein YitT (DUF2179 family)
MNNTFALNRQIPRRAVTLTWRTVRRLGMVLVGALLMALAYAVFQVPYNLAAGGLSGAAILLNHFTGLPLGTIFFAINVPVLILGYWYLGGWRFLVYTLLSVTVFAIATDVLLAVLPGVLEPFPLTDDLFLSTVYAGLLSGVGGGLVFRAGGTPGGTNTIGRLIQRRTGLPLSQSYLCVDGIIILLTVVVFGWEIALHALLLIMIMGISSDFVMEGPGMIRTVTIITDRPNEVTRGLNRVLHQGVSRWTVIDSATNAPYTMVQCAVYRSQVNDVKHALAQTDPHALVTIGTAHQVLGGRVRPIEADDAA